MDFSIVIPAYNEAALLQSTLDSLLLDGELKNCEIIIVCNGCYDDSAAKVNSYKQFHRKRLAKRTLELRVIDVKRASKTNALNVGIGNAQTATIVLLDADIKVGGNCINDLVQTLEKKHLKAMSPLVNFETTRSSLLVRSYYRVEKASFYNHNLRLSNVIALSEEGLNTLEKFPDIIADDEYLRRQFSKDEYQLLASNTYVFEAPRNLANLIAVLSRVERGNMQLARLGIIAKENTQGRIASVRLRDLIVFIAIKATAKCLAFLQYYFGNEHKWHRDASTRS